VGAQTVLARAGARGAGGAVWADRDLILVSIGGARVETVRSHLSTTDLAQLGPAAGCGKAEGRIDARQPLHGPERGAAEHLGESLFRLVELSGGGAPSSGYANCRYVG
jgi:hypothetical protein